jgi:hypothetical protein
MTESRIAATDRLRREGRYQEAAAFRDEKRRELREAGAGRHEAVEQSWLAMIDRFPPLEVNSSVVQSRDTSFHLVGAVRARSREAEPSPIDDVVWVYDHLGDEEIAADAFPGLGALSLWRWARANRASFYERLWPKAEEVSGNDVFDREIEEMEELLKHRLAVLERRFCEDPHEALEMAARNSLSFDIHPRFKTPQPTDAAAIVLASAVYDVCLPHISLAATVR